MATRESYYRTVYPKSTASKPQGDTAKIYRGTESCSSASKLGNGSPPQDTRTPRQQESVLWKNESEIFRILIINK